MTLTLTPFLRDLIDQQRAGDSYGRLDRMSQEQLLRPFLLTREQRSELPVACDVDAGTQQRIRAFYQAVAAGIEKATGVVTTTVLDLSHEGFGRVLVVAGRLVVVSAVLRDAQRFAFPTVDKLAEGGEALVAAGEHVLRTYPEVARD